MDSFNFHKLKAEKASSIQKHRQLRKIANLLRYAEVCVVIVLIFRLSFQLPVAMKITSEYLRGFSVFMVSPYFVFLVGNVIIITLFAQSGHFSAHSSAKDKPEPDFYQEFIQNSTKNQMIQVEQKKHLEKQSIRTEDTAEYPEKQSIKTESSIKNRRIDGNLIQYPHKQSTKRISKTENRIKEQRIEGSNIKWSEKQSTKTGDANTSLEVKDYRRCQSEIISSVQSEKPRRVLQRCETEKSIEAAEREGRTSYPEDGMSNEEFRLTIESFIARQQRLRRQEQCVAT